MNDRGFLSKTNSEHYDVLTVEQRKEILVDLGVPEEEVDNFPFLVGAVISIFLFCSCCYILWCCCIYCNSICKYGSFSYCCLQSCCCN